MNRPWTEASARRKLHEQMGCKNRLSFRKLTGLASHLLSKLSRSRISKLGLSLMSQKFGDLALRVSTNSATTFSASRSVRYSLVLSVISWQLKSNAAWFCLQKETSFPFPLHAFRGHILCELFGLPIWSSPRRTISGNWTTEMARVSHSGAESSLAEKGNFSQSTETKILEDRVL
jgi:hypothetical protein